jgi:hypothetical protein
MADTDGNTILANALKEQVSELCLTSIDLIFFFQGK